ncbi:MAG: dihydrodipicolinate synthase family protein [Vicinamibacterales bacterium]
MAFSVHGLVAATHTPFAADGSLNLPIVEQQLRHLLATGVATAFIGGSTGESQSLTLDERLGLATRWFEVARGTDLRIIVHVGSNCLADARTLAQQAQQLGASAISAFAPSYFKPASVEALVACCAHIAEVAPEIPFYFYDIPTMTGVHLSMPDFLDQAGDRIRNLRGIKFTNPDFMAYQRCREVEGGRFDMLWGVDEMLLPALACGAEGAVGSTYNFAAPLYHRLIAAFRRGDLAAARLEQARSIELVRTLSRRGYMASAKAMMTVLGVDVGPPRLPNTSLTGGQFAELRQELEALSSSVGTAGSEAGGP